MEVTNLTHKFVVDGKETTISEPIGFDKLKMIFKRGDYHGVAASMSLSTLEFYGDAARILQNAYNSNINKDIKYKVISTDGTLFDGAVDLSTYDEKRENYFSVSCKVGEVGIKTEFNNLTTTDVDINSHQTLHGYSLRSSQSRLNMLIPSKKIVYTNLMQARNSVVWTKDTSITGRFNLGRNKSNQWISIPVTTKNTINEFGTCEQQADIASEILADETRVQRAVINDYYAPLIDCGNDFKEKFGESSTFDIEIHVDITVEALGSLYDHPSPGCGWGSCYYNVCFCLVDEGAWLNMPFDEPQWVMAWDGRRPQMSNDIRRQTFSIHKTLRYLQGTHESKTARLHLGVAMVNQNYWDDGVLIKYYDCNPTEMKVTVHAGSYIKMTLNSEVYKSVYADIIPIADAANHVIEAISDNRLSLKSTLLGRPDFWPNPTKNYGPSSLLGITDGYTIRGLFTDEEHERNMVTTFKDMVEAIDALACVGWAITEENGRQYVRIEDWRWFYQEDVLLNITGANDITRQFDINNAITELKIGYKKYTTNSDINSIDTVHGERVFASMPKPMSKPVTKLCKFIADNYAIEATRRKALEATSEEFKYDENIFLFELAHGDGYYLIPRNVIENSSLLDTHGYNLRISPRRNALAWQRYVALFNNKEAFRFLSGTVNYKAAYRPDTRAGFVYYGNNSEQNRVISEQENIAWTKPLFRSETLKVKYPISTEQYQKIVRNPYGIVAVNGTKCWIKEFRYELITGEAEFILIPKY